MQIVVVGRFANATANGEPLSRVSVVWFLKIVMGGPAVHIRVYLATEKEPFGLNNVALII